MKLCCVCKTEKSLEEFYKNKYSKDGYKRTCKLCTPKRAGRKGYDKTKKGIIKSLPYKNVLIDNMKVCTKCNIKKENHDFEIKNKLGQTRPECKRCQNLRKLKYKYGLEPSRYLELCKLQKNLCKICSRENVQNKPLHVDHDHSTGVIRGLICFECNIMLGMSRDSIETLAKAILYLQQN